MKIADRNTIVKNVIKYTKLGFIEWNHRDEEDPYFSPTKEEYVGTYSITKTKTVDLVVTRYILKGYTNGVVEHSDITSSCNYFLYYYYNIDGGKTLHAKVGDLYYQNHYELFDLYMYAKYYNYVRKTLGIDNYVVGMVRNLHRYKWEKTNNNGVDVYTAKLETDDRRRSSGKIFVRESGWINILSYGKFPIISAQPKINLYKEIENLFKIINR